ncbi:MAG TPA: hypothetical protein VHX37_13875 [Acidobacteriaceae bacterium]|jgi:hypothetical protein|nr:hypothetical protein [Acidobacteriaceae bacterium]
MTIEDIKAQRRWVLWRLEKRDGKETKVPYQSNGAHAASDNPGTWVTYAEAAANAVRFSGVGVVMGEVDGIHLSGVDIDNCCDAVTGKFTPESREIVIGLDSYAEYSPSGTGCHILMLGTLHGRKGIKLPFPGAKAVELYDKLRYLTFTGRHLKKTPDVIHAREGELNTLYDRVQASKEHATGLTVAVTVSEAERMTRLMAGDMSLHHDDHSAADFALCCLLAKKHKCNAFKIAEEFEKSGLYRDKWDRDDYRENTITRAVVSVAKESVVIIDSDEPMEEDGPTEYLVDALSDAHEGWCPFGEVSLIGAPSGAGKTYFALTVFEKVRKGEDIWGHRCTPREWRALLHDRSKKAMGRTIKAMKLPQEVRDRIIRLSPAQQSMNPADALEAIILANPGVPVWLVEGLDLWAPNMMKMEILAPVIDALQRVATRHNVCVVATVGSPKMKGDDRYFGRDALYGSSALARKVETVILLSLTNREDGDSVRQYDIMPRNGKTEKLFMKWEPNQGLVVTEKPAEAAPVEKLSNAMAHMMRRCLQKFKPGDELVWSHELGASSTFYRWRDKAVDTGLVTYHDGKHFMTRASGSVLTEDAA